MKSSLPSPQGDWSQDPRNDPDFAAGLYPTADGKEGPSADADNPNDGMIRAFLAAYYAINRSYNSLREIRQRKPENQSEQAETECLRAVEAALRRRDSLEDEYAPYGVIAEPVMREGLTYDVRFLFGNMGGPHTPRSKPIISSAYFTIPWPTTVDHPESAQGETPTRPT